MTFPIYIRENNGLRSLHFESDCMQGAMRVADPWALALVYTQEMMAGVLLRTGDFPRKVLLIGLGAGSLVKFLYRHYPQADLTVVEIEPAVVAAAQTHFALPEDAERLHVVVGDGVAYVNESKQHYDLIVVDGFNEHAHPGDLNTAPFYQACRARLSVQGILAVNLIGLSKNYQGGFVHIAAAFAQRAVLFSPCQSGNSIAFAATGEAVNVSLAELKQRAEALAARTGLTLLPTLARLSALPTFQQGLHF